MNFSLKLIGLLYLICISIGLEKLKELLHSFIEKQGDIWQCKACEKTIKKKSHLLEHVEGVHVPGLHFLCPYCGGSHKTRASVRTHVNDKHKQEHLSEKRDMANLEWGCDMNFSEEYNWIG